MRIVLIDKFMRNRNANRWEHGDSLIEGCIGRQPLRMYLGDGAKAMTVSTISPLAAGISRTLTNQHSRVANSLQSLSSEPSNAPSNENVGGVITSSVLKTKITALRASAQNVAQATAQVDVASKGAGKIIDGLNRLQQLAVQAVSGNLSDADRTALNVEFEAILREIDTVTSGTSFGGKLLLAGGLNDADGLTVANLSSSALFADEDINVRTAENAQTALTAVQGAIAKVTGQLANIGNTGQGLQFAAASLASSIQNQQAAQSTLSDDDFVQAVTSSAAQQVQANAATALLAQTNRLGGSILALLNE